MNRRKKDIAYYICYFAYASLYIARLNLSMASPEMKAAGILTTEQIGYLGTAFSITYAAGRLINGFRSDTEQPRKMIVTGLLLCAAANIGVSLFPPFAGMLLLWCANAFAQSMLWSSVLRMVNFLYKEDELLTVRISSMVSAVATGNILAILIAMFILSRGGPAWAFAVPGFITLLMGGAVMASFPKIPESASGVKENRNPVKKMAVLLKDSRVQTALVPSICHGMMKDNVTLWMAVFFVDSFGIDIQSSAGFVLFIPLVGLAARLFYPASLKMAKNREHLVSFWSFAGCAVSALFLILVKNPLVAVISLSLVYAFTSLVNSSMVSIFPSRFEKSGCTASVSGIMDFGNYLGTAVGSFLYGRTIDSLGYGFMFATWVLISVLSMVITGKLSGSSGQDL